MWKGGLKPGQAFDGAQSPPSLTALLRAGTLGDLSDKRVFIPGCGRGYDLVSFVNAGAAEAVGLELSPTAVAAAREYVEGSLGAAAAKAPVVQGDFFALNDQNKHAYDIAFDYTFFCALHPEMRAGWANAFAHYLKPGGRLVTLIFPMWEDKGKHGPPWPVWPDLYKEHLEEGGQFKLERLEPVPPSESHLGRGGLECMAVWQRTSQ